MIENIASNFLEKHLKSRRQRKSNGFISSEPIIKTHRDDKISPSVMEKLAPNQNLWREYCIKFDIENNSESKLMANTESDDFINRESRTKKQQKYNKNEEYKVKSCNKNVLLLNRIILLCIKIYGEDWNLTVWFNLYFVSTVWITVHGNDQNILQACLFNTFFLFLPICGWLWNNEV